MNRKSHLFAILITLGFVVIAKIPFKNFYTNLGFGEYSIFSNVLTKALLILLVVFFIVRKFDLGDWGGFRKAVFKNHWLLILPLIYPGILGYSNLSQGCFQSIILMTLIAGLIQGLLEEIVFRGVIQGYLLKNLSKPTYQSVFIYTSILFSMSHFANLTHYEFGGVLNQSVFAFFIGMLFSAIQFRVRNVWLLGLIHGIINILFRGCNNVPETVLDDQNPGFLDYLTSVGSIILINIPTMLIYWVLTRKKAIKSA